MAEREGKQLGNYRLVKLLEKSGFTEVYSGEHIYLSGEKVAIKLLYPAVAKEEETIIQQVRTLENLHHPNIVRVHGDFEASTNTLYLVMDYDPEDTLQTRHPKGTRLPLSTVVEYVKPVAAALQYAHNQKLIHGDVKPEKMVLGRNGQIQISDFGLAVISHSQHLSPSNLADTDSTLYYMAPEMFQGKPRSASDQYSLGVVVYEWLCGTVPYPEGNALQLSYQHQHTPIPSLHSHDATIPSAVERVVLKALSKQPEERFDSVQAFASALESAIPTPKQSKTGIPRRAVLFGGGGAVGLALLGTGIWLLVRTRVGTGIWLLVRTREGTLYLTYRGHSDAVYSVAWSPDGKRIASGGYDGTVQVWDAANGGDVFTYRGHSTALYGVAWSPDGKRIASAGGQTVQVWDAVNGGHVFIYHGPSNFMIAVAWSPDGKRIASAGEDQTVQVWDAANGGDVFTYRGHSGLSWGVAWSPDSTRIASAGVNGTVQVWDAANGGHVFIYRGHSNSVYSVAWSPDGQRIASASADGTVQVWDITNGGVFIYHGHTDVVYSVAWSPDGKRIASGSFDKTVQVWDAVNGGHVFTYRGHSNSVIAVAWSPDSTRIASGSFDKTVQVWQA